MKRILFYIVFILTQLPLPAQQEHRCDTIHINEVIISHKQADQILPGYNLSSVDSVGLLQYSNRDLADVLTDNSAVLIKSYGAGGIAVPTFRGTGAGHTQVTWDNININNPMTGQFDLSLIPAGFIDKVELYSGAGSLDHNSGGLGGVINIRTAPEWGDRFSILLNPSAGSFGRFAGLLKFNAGSNYIQSATKIFLQTAENNFRYLNTISAEEPVKEIRKNNQVRQNGFMEELYFKVPGGVISAKLWYQYAFRNLPEPIISMQEKLNETQKDESVRSLISYSHEKGRRIFDLTAALVSDNLGYTNALTSIDSRNSARSFMLKGNYIIRIGKRTLIRSDFTEELSVIKTNNYSSTISRNTVTLGGAAETFLTDWLFASLLLRETAHDHSLVSPDFSFAIQTRVMPEKEFFISADFSKNSKVPSLNDMYWSPGGNSDLKNETGLTSEITFSAMVNVLPDLRIKSDLTCFHTLINNMIQWLPGSYSYWEAENVGRIRSTGLESSIRLLFTISNMKITADASYVLTFASGADKSAARKQLAYIPENRLNGILRLDLKHFYARSVSNFSGRRYLIPDNSQYLPCYWVNDLDLGAKLRLKNTLCDAGVGISNIFNASYQSIAWYPMPGRALMISVVFQLKTNK